MVGRLLEHPAARPRRSRRHSARYVPRLVDRPSLEAWTCHVGASFLRTARPGLFLRAIGWGLVLGVPWGVSLGALDWGFERLSAPHLTDLGSDVARGCALATAACLAFRLLLCPVLRGTYVALARQRRLETIRLARSRREHAPAGWRSTPAGSRVAARSPRS